MKCIDLDEKNLLSQNQELSDPYYVFYINCIIKEGCFRKGKKIKANTEGQAQLTKIMFLRQTFDFHINFHCMQQIWDDYNQINYFQYGD